MCGVFAYLSRDLMLLPFAFSAVARFLDGATAEVQVGSLFFFFGEHIHFE